MKLYPEELELARAYDAHGQFEELTKEQAKQILDRGRALHHWYREHLHTHFLINVATMALILGADFFVLLRLPRWFLLPGAAHSFAQVLIAGLVAGGLHSCLLYSLSVYSLHEGAAHQMIFPPRGPVTRVFNSLANNSCRLAGSDPEYYALHHMSHHAKFGTEEDGEFLNFVFPRRFWQAFLPFAAIINLTDFVAHRPITYTRSWMYSTATMTGYAAAYGYFMVRDFGWMFTLIAFLVFMPHVGFYLDRLRQFSEHNLMPLDNKDGARSFGLGFWGLVIGGGPWGQPCHWPHHLVPSVPWYQQIILHWYIRGLLTPKQRRQYYLQPVIGYPRLMWRLWTEPNAFARQMHSGKPCLPASPVNSLRGIP